MICDNKPPTEGLVQLFQHFVNYIAKLLNSSIKRQPDDDFYYEYFYTEILNKVVTDELIIADRAKYYNVEHKGLFRLLKIELHEINFAHANWILKDLTHILRNAKAFIYKSSVMVILSFSRDKEKHEKELEYNLNHIKIINEKYETYCGVSNMFTKIKDLPKQFIQTSEAVTIGKILSRKRPSDFMESERLMDESVFRYDELYVYHMIASTTKIVEASALCHYELLKIVKDDRKKGTNNLFLLYNYLVNERKATKTANEMHMHRNNILYRIKRMEEIYGFDLDDFKTRFGLLLSYKILFYEDWIDFPLSEDE